MRVGRTENVDNTAYIDIIYPSNIGGVFMVDQQQKLILSPYIGIYEAVK
jgi:hypothetical protein